MFFVPVGDFPRVEAEALAAHYNEKFGMAIGILPSLTLPRNAYDTARRQVVAERVSTPPQRPTVRPPIRRPR